MDKDDPHFDAALLTAAKHYKKLLIAAEAMVAYWDETLRIFDDNGSSFVEYQNLKKAVKEADIPMSVLEEKNG